MAEDRRGLRALVKARLRHEWEDLCRFLPFGLALLALLTIPALLLGLLYIGLLFHGETTDLGNVLSGEMYFYQQCYRERTGAWARSYDRHDPCAREPSEWMNDHPVSFEPEPGSDEVFMYLTYDEIHALGCSTSDWTVRPGLVDDGNITYYRDKYDYAWDLLWLKLRR